MQWLEVRQAARRQELAIAQVSHLRELANTERDALLEALRDINQQLLNPYESISDGFFMLDNAWKISYVNGLAASLIRRNKADLVGAIFWEQYPFLIGTPVESNYRRAASEKIPIEFEQFYAPWGRWLEVRIFPLLEGLSVYFCDITKRHRSEEQLKLLGNCVGHLPDIVMVTEFDPLGTDIARITYVNTAFQKRTGYHQDDVVGRTPRSLVSNTEHGASGELPPLHSSSPCYAGRSESLHVTKNGRPFWVDQETVEVMDASGAVTNFISVARDITERKQKKLKSDKATSH